MKGKQNENIQRLSDSNTLDSINYPISDGGDEPPRTDEDSPTDQR